MNKQQLITAIINQLQAELSTAITASEVAHESATHSENIADNKYDTLGLEAAYLAHGQSIRITELQEAIDSYQHFQPVDLAPQSTAQLGALIEIENNDCEIKTLFIGPTAGGLTVGKPPETVQVITTAAPLAQALLGKYPDDEVTLTINQQSSHFTINYIE